MKKEVSFKNFTLVMIILVVIEVVLLFVLMPQEENTYHEEYCLNAICNEDASICYAYDVSEDGETEVVWRGSCQD